MTMRQDDLPGDKLPAHGIRVLHVGPGWKQRGGIASVLEELAMQRSRFASENVFVSFFETHGFHRASDLLQFFLQDVPRFVAALRQVDIVHFHVSEKGSFYRKVLLFSLAKVVGKKTIFHLHSGNFGQFVGGGGDTIRRLVSWFIGNANAAIGVSSATAEVLRRYAGTTPRIYVIGNMARLAEYAGSTGSFSQMESSDSPYVAFAGRFSVEKGVHLLMESLALLKRQGCPVHLRLAGAGETRVWMRMAAEREVDDRVAFMGWLDGDAKLAFYRNARLFCMPSRFESFGISALEAMFCGTPVIGTRLGGFLDLVEEGVTGHLIEPGDAEALANRIRGLVEDPPRAASMGAAAQQRARLKYSTETIVLQYVECYRVIERSRQ
ncbi:glycosyltransferase family 4 protein [Paraburkholderia flava]|uniref:glycosyltransferase family 4 protein n=1 Tax=Paraburkholderia flava TaxID=2547393 RepID=UPI00105B3823|nr:glycosyltransferase family 4 protein [Paraburkholderia flava]